MFDPLPDAVRNIRITFNLGADDFQYDIDEKSDTFMRRGVFSRIGFLHQATDPNSIRVLV